MTPLAIVVAALATVTVAADPSELLDAEVPAGFEQADGADADLTFEEYAALAPEATEHVDPTSAEARAMRAGVDVWTAGDGDVLVREVTLWTTAEAAREFVERGLVVGIENDLDEAGAPFEGGLAFLGADEGLWTRTLTWRQGPYGITVSHFSIEEGSDRTIGQAAETLAVHVEAATGHAIAASGVRPDATDGTEPEDIGGASGGIPVGAVLIWSAVVAGVIWLFMARRMIARRSDNSSQGRSGETATGDRNGATVERRGPDTAT